MLSKFLKTGSILQSFLSLLESDMWWPRNSGYKAEKDWELSFGVPFGYIPKIGCNRLEIKILQLQSF